MLRTAAALATACGLVLLSPLPALAAAPSNDTIAGATPITAFPFDAVVDTSQATTDATDAALNASCGAPVTNGSVWYSYTAPAGVDGLVVDVSASDYSSGVIIAESDGAGGYVLDSCGPGSTGTQVTPGTTYYVMAFSDTAGVTGGHLRLHADAAAFPKVDVAISPRGKVDKQGNALISGTYRCSDADFISIDTFVKQPVGRVAISGYGFTGDSACDGAVHPWSTVVVPDNGKFAGGKAVTVSYGFSCGAVFCADSYAETTVKLSK